MQDLISRTSRAYPTPPQISLGRPSFALDFDTRPARKVDIPEEQDEEQEVYGDQDAIIEDVQSERSAGANAIRRIPSQSDRVTSQRPGEA